MKVFKLKGLKGTKGPKLGKRHLGVKAFIKGTGALKQVKKV